MESKLKIESTADAQLIGSSDYTIILTVTNTSGEEITNLIADPVVMAGQLRPKSGKLQDVTLGLLETERRLLLTEMEQQVGEAFLRKRLLKSTPIERFWLRLSSTLPMFMLFMPGLAIAQRKSETIPSWAEQAMSIRGKEDADRLEKEIVSLLPEDEFVRVAFSINKAKLDRCLEKLETERAAHVDDSSSGITLLPGASISFAFTARAPRLLKSKSRDVQFKVSFRANSKDWTQTHGQKLTFLPSWYAVPLGGLVGAFLGYCIRLALMKATVQPVLDYRLALSFVGSLTLGFIIALFTARSPENKRPITVEDFGGGLLIGVAAGMFSDLVVAKLEDIVKSTIVAK